VDKKHNDREAIMSMTGFGVFWRRLWRLQRPSLFVLIFWSPLFAAMSPAQELAPLAPSGTVAKNRSGALAGNQTATEPASGLLEKSGSDVSQVPVQLRPFILTLPRNHLLGDWGGLLPKTEDTGITPTLTYVSDIAGNPTGGKSHGISYDDNIGLALEFDLKKLAGLDGGSFLISLSQRDGDSLSRKDVGNVFSVQQLYGGETFHLVDVAYQQKLFDDKLELSIGRIAAGDDFLVSAYDYLFMQNGFDGNPVAIFDNSPGMNSYPNATWGTRLKVMPTKRTYLMVGVYNGDSSIRANDNHGADLSMRGPVFGIAEAGYKYNGLPGDSQFLGNYKAFGTITIPLPTTRPLGTPNPPVSRRTIGAATGCSTKFWFHSRTQPATGGLEYLDRFWCHPINRLAKFPTSLRRVLLLAESLPRVLPTSPVSERFSANLAAIFAMPSSVSNCWIQRLAFRAARACWKGPTVSACARAHYSSSLIFNMSSGLVGRDSLAMRSSSAANSASISE
jgi:hypothetical protein